MLLPGERPRGFSHLRKDIMKYEIQGMIPLQPVLVRYKEDDQEREDLFYLSPENGAMIPAFGPGEGPKEMGEFIHAFREGFRKMVENQQRRIIRATPIPPGAVPQPGTPPGTVGPGGQIGPGRLIVP